MRTTHRRYWVFFLLFLFRALLGIGMGAEWPAGASLAMESWPPRSRGFMSGVLQGSWGIGFALSALAFALLNDAIGWRGLLWLGILPALVFAWMEPSVTGLTWTACVKADVTGMSGNIIRDQILQIEIFGGQIRDRRRADATSPCLRATYEPL